MKRTMISANFVEEALTSLTESGIDPAPVLSSFGLPCPVIRSISNDQYGALWVAISKLLQDEFFGLGARPMRPGSFALLCQSVLHTKNLEHALRRALRFMKIVLDHPSGTLLIEGDHAKIVLTSSSDARTAFAFRTFLLIIMGVSHWLVGRRFPILSLDFACPPPENSVEYYQFFGAPVQFNKKQSNLVFSAAHLKLPTIRTEKALKSFLDAAPANVLVRYRHDKGLNTKIRFRLRSIPPLDWPMFNDIAKITGLSPATLRRRLRSEGHSFVSIKDEIRNIQAQQLLRETDINIADIAARLGYSEPSAFHRAFHKWVGQSPGAFRKA